MAISKDIREKVEAMTPLSQSAVQLLQLTSSGKHSMQDMVKIIEFDNVLTASILKIANSVAYKPKSQVSSVGMAVSLLGERTVVGAAMEICSNQVYDIPLEGYESPKGSLWRHSLYTAIAARELAKLAKMPVDQNQAFTGGILHDIGKIVISRFLEGSANELVSDIEEHEVESYIIAEEKRLGTDHCEVGGLLAEHWKLPDCYLEVIKYHHVPGTTSDESRVLAYAVHVGDMLAMMNGFGTGSDSMLYRLDPEFANYFTLGEFGLQEVILAASEEYEKVNSSIS